MSATTLRRPERRASAPPGRGRLQALLRGSETEARWVRPAVLALLACTAIAYLVNLTASGDANSFYAAAVQAGTKSWKAFLFGSIDSSNFITVDKPPAALWVMELSGRILGFSSFSMLLPEVLEGVAAVALMYAGVKRWFGAPAGLIAGAVLAMTPVAALMFRFNNPDALLTCLLVAGAYCMVRALERASARWIVAAGTAIGFAFLAKMMQAFLVLPAFALVYAVTAPTGLRRRLFQLLAGGAAILVSAGWWVALVELWPAASRPMIDGTTDNSILNLILDYNGLGRIFGNGGGGKGGGGGLNFSGSTGLLRLFDDSMGGQASWLIPAALIALIAGLVMTRRAPRTDRRRAALLMWGGWLIVTGLVFSYGKGTIHTYYTVALAPAIAALVAIGAVMLWRERRSEAARWVLAVAVAATAAWAWALLDRTPGWEPWLRWLIAGGGVLATAGILVGLRDGRLSSRAAVGIATLAAIVCLGGPAAYAAQTISTAHSGSVPSAGPSSSSSIGGLGSIGGRGGFGSSTGKRGVGSISSRSKGGLPAFAGKGKGDLPSAAGKGDLGSIAGRGGNRSAGGAGFGGTSTVSATLKQALESDSGHYKWVAAVSGSQTAASLELATGGDPVMAIGGFSGNSGDFTLAQFKSDVAHGEIHYYIASSSGGGLSSSLGGRSGFPGSGSSSSARSGSNPFTAGKSGKPSGSISVGGRSRSTADVGGGSAPGATNSSTSAITQWVKAHYRSEKIGGETVYNLTQPK